MDIDTPKGIISRYPDPLWAVRSSEGYSLLKALQEIEYVKSCFPFGQEFHVVFKTEDGKSRAEKLLKDKGFENTRFDKIEAGIEDCFMAYMKLEKNEGVAG